ncbi:MAG TPA: MmcQ/YjbR family DNA-binding protein, partial [Candidatus Limnocylindrales bacterium]
PLVRDKQHPRARARTSAVWPSRCPRPKRSRPGSLRAPRALRDGDLGEGSTLVSIKARPDRQAELIDLDPETFASAAYVGRFGWVTVDLGRIDPALLASLLAGAWRLTAPKRLITATERGT